MDIAQPGTSKESSSNELMLSRDGSDIYVLLQATSGYDSLKHVLKNRLESLGWKEEMAKLCSQTEEAMKNEGIPLTTNNLYKRVLKIASAMIPDQIIEEMKIRINEKIGIYITPIENQMPTSLNVKISADDNKPSCSGTNL